MMPAGSVDAGGLGRPALGLEPMFGRKRRAVDATVDMTAMIDLVFMLNIFFLVTSIVTALAEIDLPAAQHVVAVDMESSVVFSILAVAEGNPPLIYLGDPAEGERLSADDPTEQIAAAVAEAASQGKTTVVIKAEKNVPLREIVRLAAAATSEQGMTLSLAVMEKD
jgi:biopolymer transport protein ExbD